MDILHLLVEAGADKDVADYSGDTALMLRGSPVVPFSLFRV